MITSQQVNQMHMSSMQMHGAAPGMMQAQPNMGMSQYPPTFSYSMAGAQNPNERIGNRLIGAGIGATEGIMGAAGTVNLAAGLGTMGAGFLGMGAAVPASIAALGSMPVTLGLAGAGVGIAGMAAGHRQMAQTNQIFGNQMFANAANPMGRGFSRGDLNTLYGAVRAIDRNDPFVSMGDALRVTQSSVSEFGMAQGVENAEKLAKKVTEMGKTLAQMAKTMGTTIDEAKEVFGMSRQAGFYSASDVMGNTQNFMVNRGLGFTSQQTAGMQVAGAQAARGAGLSGQSGARFATGMTQNLALQMQMGTISDTALMDATGTMTRNDAATSFAQTAQGMFTNMGQSAYGSAVLGALMTRDGQGGVGINQGLLEGMRSGSVTLSDLRNRAGRNLSTQQGKLDFVNNRDQLMGDLMSSEDSMSALINTIEAEAQRSGKDVQVLVQQITGLNARDYRLIKEASENFRQARQERLKKAMNELNAQQHQQNIRENATLGGISQRISGSISDFFQDNFVDPGAQMVGNMGVGMERLKLATLEMAGRGQASFKVGSGRFDELSRAAMLSNIGASTTSLNQDALTLATGGDISVGGTTFSGSRANTTNDRLGFLAAAGNTQGLGRELRRHRNDRTMSRLTNQDKDKIRDLMRQIHRTDDPDEQAELLKEARNIVADRNGDVRDLSTRDGFGFAIKEDALAGVDSAIAEVAGESGVTAIRKGRRNDGFGGGGDAFNSVKAAQEAMNASIDIGSTFNSKAAATGALIGGGIGAIAGAFFGAGVGAPPGYAIGAGVGLAVGGLVGTLAGGKNLQKQFEQGVGVGLLAKAKTARGMKAIDSIIASGLQGDGSIEEKRVKIAEQLSAQLGIDVSSEDVEIYEAAMAQKTGTTDAQDRADRSVQEYEETYADALELGGMADKVELGLATELGVQQLQAQSNRLASDLSELGLGDAAITEGGGTLSGLLSEENVDIAGFQKGVANIIKEMSTKGVTADQVQGKGPLAQFLQQQASRLSEVEAGLGPEGMSVEKFAREFQLSGDDPMLARAMEIAGEDGMLSKEETMDLVSSGLAQEATALGLESAGALTTAAQAGKSPMQIQAESVQKAAEMIDAIYSRMSGTPPANPDSPAALGAGWNPAGNNGEGYWGPQ